MSVINKIQLIPLIDSLSEQLQQLDLWSDEIPPQSHLLSTEPFCCDCLSLDAWLQFVFIPKINDLLLQDHVPCFACGIYPIAQESFKHLLVNTSNLLLVIKEIDETLSGNE